jgi:uncharacterized coiled-coil protein SlyX
MDSKFLEFWGNYMLAAAKGQQQLEDLNKWINQGFSGFKELSAVFQKYYDLEAYHKKNHESNQAWQLAEACFRDSFEAYLYTIGAVPVGKYRQLEQNLTDLEKKVAERDETITILRDLLAEKGTYQGETVKALQDLVNKQAGAFESFMKNIAETGKDEKES